MRFDRKVFLTLVFALLLSQKSHAYNYSDISWKTTETEHFVIHYYDDIAWTAQKAAVVAEEIYPKVTGYYGHQPKKKTHLILRDDEDTSNGFAIYHLNSMTIWASPSSHRLRGQEDWLRAVVTHEFSHIVSLQAASPTALAIEGLRLGAVANGNSNENADLGGSIFFPASNYSRWWAEGTAQLDTFTAGYDPFDTHRHMLLRASMLENNLLTFDQMRNISVRDNFGGELVYNQGYSFLLWLRENYGEQINVAIAKSAATRWNANFDRSLKQATGKPAQELYEDWKQDLSERYRKQLGSLGEPEQAGKPIPLVSEKKLAQVPKEIRGYHDGVQIAYPRFSPDGRWFSWVNQNTLHLRHLNEPYRLDPLDADKKPRPLNIALAGKYYSWSPDSKKIVLSKRRPTQLDGYPYFDLYIADLTKLTEIRNSYLQKFEGAQNTNDRSKAKRAYLKKRSQISIKPKRLTRRLRATHPAWSPDGQWIAFSANQDGHRDLKMINPTGTKIHDMVTVGGDSEATDAAWSPDGKHIVYSFYHRKHADIWSVDLERKLPRALTYETFENREPQFTKDGQGIVFSSDRTGIFQLYHLSLRTSPPGLTALSRVTTGAFMPFLTPEQNQLLYVRFSSYGFKPYALELTSEHFQPTTSFSVASISRDEEKTMLTPESFPILTPGKKYFPWLRTPRIFPSVLYENSQVKAGAALQLSDHLEKHEFMFSALFGKDQDYQAVYYNNMFTPTLMGSYTSYVRNTSYEFFNDGDKLADEPKSLLRDNIQFVTLGASQDFRLNDILDGNHQVSLYYEKRFVDRHLGYPSLIKDKPTTDFRLLTNDELHLRWSFMQKSAASDRDFDISPRNFTSLDVNYSLIHTRLFSADPTIPAPNADYFHHEALVSFQQSYALSKLSELRWHSLGFRFTGGYKSRNVNVNDEFYLGGRINFRAFGQINNNTLFYGYEDFSISGETLLLLNTNYSFPIKRSIDRKYGAYYLDSIYASIFHEVGNVWDYGSIRNATNKSILLQDVGVGLKVKAFLFNDYNRCNTDLKVAYGFQDDAAHGFSDTDSPIRIYLAVGTDF